MGSRGKAPGLTFGQACPFRGTGVVQPVVIFRASDLEFHRALCRPPCVVVRHQAGIDRGIHQLLDLPRVELIERIIILVRHELCGPQRGSNQLRVFAEHQIIRRRVKLVVRLGNRVQAWIPGKLLGDLDHPLGQHHVNADLHGFDARAVGGVVQIDLDGVAEAMTVEAERRVTVYAARPLPHCLDLRQAEIRPRLHRRVVQQHRHIDRRLGRACGGRRRSEDGRQEEQAEHVRAVPPMECVTSYERRTFLRPLATNRSAARLTRPPLCRASARRPGHRDLPRRTPVARPGAISLSWHSCVVFSSFWSSITGSDGAGPSAQGPNHLAGGSNT